MWIKKFGIGNNAYRYRVYTDEPLKLITEDGETTMFAAERYWNTDGNNWKKCKENSLVYITVEQLMESFVKEDSALDNAVKDLQEFRRTVKAESLDNLLSPFALSSIEVVPSSTEEARRNLDPASSCEVTNLDTSGPYGTN